MFWSAFEGKCVAINLRFFARRLMIGLILVSSFWAFVKPSFAVSHGTEGMELYKKNLKPEHKLKLAFDIKRYHDADNLWDVLRDEFSLPHYENNPIVHEKMMWYLDNQVYLLRTVTRAAPYLYYILQQVKKRHLPAEIVLLPIIESGYDPFSLSNVGAAGIWQLMPDTATDRGIKQDWWYDGRRDIIASTRAALNYLVYLENFFNGNWLLALAAYNTGEGNVSAAIKRNIRNGRGTDFWSLPVAQQTRDYVPSLLALAAIISDPDRYPIALPPVKNAPYLAQVDVGSQINLKFAASLAGMSYKALKRLNPGYNRSSTSSRGPHKLILPIVSIIKFTENLLKNPLAGKTDWSKYKIQSGDTLISIAKKFQVSVIALRRMNELKSHMIRPGAILLVPSQEKKPTSPFESIEKLATKQKIDNTVKNQEQVAIRSAFTKAKYRLASGDTIYMVRNKDTLSSIAEKFHIDRELLQKVNQLNTTDIKVGEHLVIPTHVRNPSSKNNLIPGDTLYMVRNGDTIEKIALKFHTTPAAIRLANLIDNHSLEEGEKLVVPTHFRG